MDRESYNDINILYYDGLCGFCNHWVRWVLNNDINHVFRFCSLQSQKGRAFLNQNGFSTEQLDTLYVKNSDNIILEKFDAVLFIANNLRGKFYALNILKIFPRFLRDFIYNIVSKYRKRLSANYCIIVSDTEKMYFIE